jgi:hypothetical protein
VLICRVIALGEIEIVLEHKIWEIDAKADELRFEKEAFGVKTLIHRGRTILVVDGQVTRARIVKYMLRERYIDI